MTKKPSRWAALLALVLLIAISIAAWQAKPASSQAATQTPVVATATSGSPTSSAATSSAATSSAATSTSTSAARTPVAATATRTPFVATPTRTPIVPTLSPGTTTTPSVPVTANTTPRTVSVSGRGIIEGQPDQAVVSLGVRTEDENAASALNKNSAAMQALISALRSGGVAAGDIRTLTIQLYPRYQPPPVNDPGGSPVVNGFIATNMVEVTVRDLANLGSLLDSAVQAGGNQVEGIRFDISNQQAMLDQAREAAMLDARRKAEQYATLAGARLGAVLTITESSAAPLPYLREVAPQAADSSVPVSPGTQPIQVDIQVTWELQ